MVSVDKQLLTGEMEEGSLKWAQPSATSKLYPEPGGDPGPWSVLTLAPGMSLLHCEIIQP